MKGDKRKKWNRKDETRFVQVMFSGWGRKLSRILGGKEVNPHFCLFVSILTNDVRRVFYYFEGLHDCGDCKSWSFCIYGVFGYCLSLVLPSGVSNVFQDSSGDMTAHLVDIHLHKGAGESCICPIFVSWTVGGHFVKWFLLQ
jgi:hypothetical protein